MISCSEAVNQLWEYLDGTVEDSDRRAIEEHLSVCQRCCGELEFAEELRRFLADSAHQEIPDDVRARLNTVLKELGDR
jgi:mycothiol system anti-sigma-R factor